MAKVYIMIKVLIARHATIGLAYMAANAVKAGTGLTDDHQDGNDGDDDDDDGGEDEDEDEIFTLFSSLPFPSMFGKRSNFCKSC